MSSRGAYYIIKRHSCEGRNPENSVTRSLDARLRGHDGESTLPPHFYKLKVNIDPGSADPGFFSP